MNDNQNWERALLEQLASASLIEHRRARRWKIFFRLAWLILAVIVIASLCRLNTDKAVTHFGQGYTALLRLNEVINSENETADKLIRGLNDAFSDKNMRGIVIRANSPGGSPVLSGMVYDEIVRLKKRYPTIPVYAVVEEMCASGCYYIISATDKIFVNKASLIGSIGVIAEGFGLTGLISKLGIERRIKTAGINKAMGDPFSPVTQKEELALQQMLNDTHAQFIKAVRDGRGARLKETPDTFSGLVWIGERSIPLGLADGYGTVESIARDVIKAEQVIDLTPEEDWGSRFARKLGVDFIGGLSSILRSALW